MNKNSIIIVLIGAVLACKPMSSFADMYQSPFSTGVETPTLDYFNSSRTYGNQTQQNTEDSWSSTSYFGGETENNYIPRSSQGYNPINQQSWGSAAYSNSDVFNEIEDFTMVNGNKSPLQGAGTTRDNGSGTSQIQTKDTGTGVVEPIPDSILLLLFGCIYALHTKRRNKKKD